MKYQSEIIKEIIDMRGHDKSSHHYESECIESWIAENKGAYPKLCDYQSEWLNYINENPIGEFPYETLVDVTEATINNVVPYAYKSAILKGQTLVNLFNNKSSNGSIGQWGIIDQTRYTLMKGKTYTFKINVLELSGTIEIKGFEEGVQNWYWSTSSVGEYAVSIVIKNDCTLKIRAIKQTSFNLEYVLIEGDYTNIDIPYFTGMQSVKMPVLTTSNEDGTKTNILTVNEDVELRGIGDVKDTLDCLTGELTERIGGVVLDGSDDEIWRFNKSLGDGSYNQFVFSSTINAKKVAQQLVVCDKLASNVDENLNNVIWFYDGKTIVIHSGCASANELKSWLQSNPITVQYELATESIKTVDLTVVNQDGENVSLKPIEGTMHLSTSSETIRPLFSGEIPVEATTQNLESFIEG